MNIKSYFKDDNSNKNIFFTASKYKYTNQIVFTIYYYTHLHSEGSSGAESKGQMLTLFVSTFPSEDDRETFDGLKDKEVFATNETAMGV